DLGLADAGGADHQDVFRQDLLAQFVVELKSAPPVTQGDSDGALGVVLADDVAVELGDDFAGREVGHSFLPSPREAGRGYPERSEGWVRGPCFSMNSEMPLTRLAFRFRSMLATLSPQERGEGRSIIPSNSRSSHCGSCR